MEKIRKSRVPVRGWHMMLVFFVLFQISLTLTGRNIWPFSSHAFFAFNLPDTIETDTLSYYDSSGRRLKADASSFMPVEFFKAHRIAEYVMTSKTVSEEDKKRFFLNVFQRAKYSPWGRFDETYPALKIPADFVPVRAEITLDNKTYDFGKYGVAPHVVEAPPLASVKLTSGE
ncbi:hypothetical protein TH60_21310 [Pantoea ananatis]|nr:hypothetical protein [Pantoea ananatis]